MGFLASAVGAAVVAAGDAERLRAFKVEDFIHSALHDDSEDAVEARRCFSVVEDNDEGDGEALSVKLNVPLVRKSDFALLRTPSLADSLPTGTYRVTVRMKVEGMLHTLGSAVAISAGGTTRTVWMNEFLEEDVYQDFDLLFESRPGDVVTKRDVYFWSAPGGPDSLVDRAALPGIFDRLARNDLPWEDRFSLWMVEHVVALRWKLDREAIPKSVERMRAALRHVGPDGIRIDTLPDSAGLTKEDLQTINQHGANRPNGSVSLHFPKNITTGSGGTRGISTPQPTLRTVTVNRITLERMKEPDHSVIRQVSCRYPWRRPGEKQVFSLWLHNRSGSAKSDTVRVLLRSGLRHEEILLEAPVPIADGGYERILLPWEIPADQPLWGQSVTAQVLKDGRVVSEESGWFALHHRSNAVMIFADPNTERFLHPYATEPPRTRNHREIFGANGTIYDSAGVVPDEDAFFDPYPAGNGTYMMSIPTLHAITRGLSDAGLAPFFYLETHGTGVRAAELYWQYPERVVSRDANMDAFLIAHRTSVEEWRVWNQGGRQGPRPEIYNAGEFVKFNGLFEENVTRVIDGCLTMCEHTDFTGIRWDTGIPFQAHNGKALGGTWGKTDEELASISVANIRRFKTEMRARRPSFEIRANDILFGLFEHVEDPYDFNRAYETMRAHPVFMEFLSDHGSIMEEGWGHSYGGFGSDLRSCLDYLRLARFENAAIKMAGGHNGHMTWVGDWKKQAYTPDEIYQMLFSFLAGAHFDSPYGPIPESLQDFGVYALRFSEFFWDPALRPILDLPDKVSVDTDAYLWIHEAGFERETRDGGFLQIIPIINPPVSERWMENRFGMLPEPLREPFGMTVRLPDGFQRVRGVYLLDNHPHPHVRELAFKVNGGEVVFDIPELAVFKVVALEYAP